MYESHLPNQLPKRLHTLMARAIFFSLQFDYNVMGKESSYQTKSECKLTNLSAILKLMRLGLCLAKLVQTSGYACVVKKW